MPMSLDELFLLRTIILLVSYDNPKQMLVDALRIINREIRTTKE